MKYPFFPAQLFKRFIILLTGFTSFSAIVSGIQLIRTNGLGMPTEWISGTFSSFLIPGLILVFIVGGTNLFALIMTVRNWAYAMEANMVAGFGLLIWIYSEMYLISQRSGLQTIYFALAIFILVLTFLLYARSERH